MKDYCLPCKHCGISSQVSVDSMKEIKHNFFPESHGQAYFFKIHREKPAYHSFTFEELPVFFTRKYDDVVHIRVYHISINSIGGLVVGSSYRYNDAKKTDKKIIEEIKDGIRKYWEWNNNLPPKEKPVWKPPSEEVKKLMEAGHIVILPDPNS